MAPLQQGGAIVPIQVNAGMRLLMTSISLYEIVGLLARI